jgi:DNA recombination protein RmuC
MYFAYKVTCIITIKLLCTSFLCKFAIQPNPNQMEIAILTLLLVTLTFQIIGFAIARKQKADTSTDEAYKKLDFIEKNLSRFETVVKDDFRQNREELGNNLAKFQQTFLETLKEISRNQQEQLSNISELNQKAIASLNKTIEERMNALLDKNERINTSNREALERSLKSFQDSFTANVKDFNDLQKQKFADLEKKQGELITSTELKLEKMRETVDEKLQKTLEARLGQSFELVSKQLESVQKGLGEMQTLASDVGGLKRVLSNVKTRGMLGEIQLGNILEQILAPEQYEKNVRTKKSSSDQVEFAIKLPGRDDNNEQVYLPIDAKFPQEAYHLLQTAYDEASPEKVDTATKALSNAISKAAKDISEKYLDPPFTTDFGIMFLPIEGLYAEVVRNTDLIEQLQRKYKIVVTGPTTLAAILNSLQMGFKTLAIQKRSSEVWQILGAVKTEFGKFGTVLKKTQERINQANNELDTLVGTRTRAIERKLQKIQELPSAETTLLINETLFDDDADEMNQTD